NHGEAAIRTCHGPGEHIGICRRAVDLDGIAKGASPVRRIRVIDVAVARIGPGRIDIACRIHGRDWEEIPGSARKWRGAAKGYCGPLSYVDMGRKHSFYTRKIEVTA